MKRQDALPSYDPEKLGADCAHCPLKHSRQGVPVPGQGPAKPLIALVGEAPGPTEVKLGFPFAGKSGDLLEGVLATLGVNRTSIYIDNALACLPPGIDLEVYFKVAKKEAKEDGEDFVSPIDCCRPRLLRALGVPRCDRCDMFQLGVNRCVCKRPRWVYWEHRVVPTVVVPMGNAALMSLLGVTGIKKRRGAPVVIG